MEFSNKPLFTTIQHLPRKLLGLSCNDYCIADMIHGLAFNPKNKNGWCYCSRQVLGDMIGLSKVSVIQILKFLEKEGIVEVQEHTKYLRTTAKWFNAITYSDIYKDADNADLTGGKESLPIPDLTGGKESLPTGKESLPATGKESLPYNNTLYNNSNKKENAEQPKTTPLQTKKEAEEKTAEVAAAPPEIKTPLTQEEIDFENFQLWIKSKAPNVAKMQQKFTMKEFQNLLKDGFTYKTIKELLLQMHNWKPLLTKNVSANLTLRHWHKRDEL